MNTKSIKKQNIPVYIGVYNALYSDIVSGVYPAGEILPGEKSLSEKYGVSRNTLRQALAILNEDGMIIKSQGKGTLIAPHPARSMGNKILNPLIHLSKLPVTETEFSYNIDYPTDIARDKLKLSSEEKVLACNCVYRSESNILGYTFTQIPSAFFHELGMDPENKDSIEKVIIDSLFQHTSKLSMTIKLIFANEIEIEFLGVQIGTPLILIEALHHGHPDQILARNKYYFLPDYYHLSLDFPI